MGLLAFPCFLPGYYDTLTPWYPLLPYLPMSAFDLQPIIGRLSFFLTADVAKVSGIGPASCSIMMLAVILGSELLFFLLERAGTGRRWQRILQNGASVGNPPKEAALAVNDLSMRVGKHELLENASLELRAREVTGLIAPNGFGKTTLLNALWGNPVIHYTCSSFLIDGLPCQDDERTRKKMFLLPSDGRFFLDHQTGRYHLEATLGLWHSDGSLQQVIKDLCLEPFIDKRMARLSAGQRQLIGIATACLSEADILLLDEPMNALDPTNVRSASKAIEASSNRGSAVLLSSHILENLEELCGAFIFMSQRRLLMDEKGGDSASIKERYQQLYER